MSVLLFLAVVTPCSDNQKYMCNFGIHVGHYEKHLCEICIWANGSGEEAF